LHKSREPLIQALGLPASGNLVSIVGGGGKSALLFALGRALPGRVLLTTTTRIFASQINRANESCELIDNDLEAKLAGGTSGLLVIGQTDGDRAVGVPPSLPALWLARDDVQHVIVESDGSRMRPVKAPAEHEPVIAMGSTHVAIVVGIDALDAPIESVAHRPERVGELLDLSTDACLDTQHLAQLIGHPMGGLKGIPETARVIAVINKVEGAAREEQAAAVAEAALGWPRVDRVICGALEGSNPNEWMVYQSVDRSE
jgi:molybdenum cofactor cytidylyltransferase